MPTPMGREKGQGTVVPTKTPKGADRWRVAVTMADGRRVFVTALTHRAIHNALNKIPKVDSALPVCKIGEGRHSGDLDVPNFETFASSRFGENSGGYHAAQSRLQHS